MTQTDGEIHHVLGLNESILWKWLYNPKRSRESVQNPCQVTNGIFHRIRTKNFTICLLTQKTLNSQSNLEKERWTWRNQPPWLQTIPQSYSNQDSMALAQKQKHSSMEQDRNVRDKPMHLWALYLWPKRQEYIMEKRQPLQKVVLGKLDR